MQLSGSLALLASAVLMNYTQAAGRLAVVSALAGLVVAVVLTGLPEFDRLTAGASAMPWPKRLAALDVRFAIAGAVGLFAFAAGVRYLRGPGSRIEPLRQRSIERASSDNFGHADWMEIDEALRLFNAGRTPKGGIVLGEAYRVDRDAVADRRFDPRDRSSWGLGGRTSLLVLDLTPDTSHGLVFAGSGGFKTVSVCVPALLTYRGPAVVLDPTGELSSMLSGARERMSRRVVAIDPEARDPVGFNVLDWIDITGPSADADIRSVVDWICGERPPDSQRGISGSSAFFEGRGKALVEALLSDLLFDPHLRPGERTLKGLAPRLALPEREMRKELARIHAGSTSAKARHIAGQLKELVDETFSGVYGNMSEQTEWLANVRYASLVSGNSFRTRDLASGKLDIFLNLSLKVMAATPALARCIVGALLNGVYEAKGRVEGRVLFLLDEVGKARLHVGLEPRAGCKPQVRHHARPYLPVRRSARRAMGRGRPRGLVRKRDLALLQRGLGRRPGGAHLEGLRRIRHRHALESRSNRASAGASPSRSAPGAATKARPAPRAAGASSPPTRSCTTCAPTIRSSSCGAENHCAAAARSISDGPTWHLRSARTRFRRQPRRRASPTHPRRGGDDLPVLRS